MSDEKGMYISDILMLMPGRDQAAVRGELQQYDAGQLSQMHRNALAAVKGKKNIVDAGIAALAVVRAASATARPA